MQTCGHEEWDAEPTRKHPVPDCSNELVEMVWVKDNRRI